jgi:hypothetical protein
LQENRELAIESKNMKANLNSSQILCWHCEEIVHAYAARCPYCNKDLTTPQQAANQTQSQSPFQPAQIAPPSDKIAHIAPMADIVRDAPRAHPDAANHEDAHHEAANSVSETFTVLISLAALLAGSFFLFFGVIIKLFATNGTFVLEWNASSWPYFVGSALVLLILGLYTLSKLEQE